MSIELLQILWSFGIFIVILAVIGLYCLLATYNLIRALIGLEIMIKAATLLVIVVGYVTGRTALTQALVVTFITIEVVVMAVAIGVVLGIRHYNNSLDTRKIRNLKG